MTLSLLRFLHFSNENFEPVVILHGMRENSAKFFRQCLQRWLHMGEKRIREGRRGMK